MARNVLLIGSIPLGSAEEVFATVAARLGDLVPRLPDGETGARRDWVRWQAAHFARIPFVEAVKAAPAGVPARHGAIQFRVRPGFPTASVRFGPLGYAAAAADSFAVFAALKAAGTIPARCRFQVGLASALSVVGQYVDTAFQAAIEPAYEDRLLAEVDDIAAAVPHGELAVQWNLATELSLMAGHRPAYFAKTADGVLARTVRLCERIPDEVELGLHLCFHDFARNHFPLPRDLDRVIDLANGLLGTIGRAIGWIHLPAPAAVADAAYFAPLRRLLLRPETEVYLGLVDAADGLAGTRRRIEAARGGLRRFGVAAACGLGGVAAADIGAVLDLHRAAASIE